MQHNFARLVLKFAMHAGTKVTNTQIYPIAGRPRRSAEYVPTCAERSMGDDTIDAPLSAVDRFGKDF